MTMKQFIQANRAELDEAINSVLYRWDGNGGEGQVPNPPPKRGDEERKMWIVNDEYLYNWARSEGVRG